MMFMLFSTSIVSWISSMDMQILVMYQVYCTHTSLLLNILFGLQDLLWCGYWCVCITLLYLDLRLLQC